MVPEWRAGGGEGAFSMTYPWKAIMGTQQGLDLDLDLVIDD
jgi:hypothetical protein